MSQSHISRAGVTSPQPAQVPVVQQPLQHWTQVHQVQTGHGIETFGSQSVFCRECRTIVRQTSDGLVEYDTSSS